MELIHLKKKKWLKDSLVWFEIVSAFMCGYNLFGTKNLKPLDLKVYIMNVTT